MTSTQLTPSSIPTAVPNRKTIVIQPTRGWASLRLGELWEYRDLLFFMTWRDIRARYRQTALGPLWIILHPLMSMVLYSAVFGGIAGLPSDNQPYTVFTYVALLPWQFFTDAISSGTNAISSGLGLSAKVYFPRLIVPISHVLSSLIDLSISFVILFGMMLYYQLPLRWEMLWLPVYLLLAAVVGLGVGLWMSGAIVKYRDFSTVASYLIRIWMFATPVVYSISVIDPAWLPLYRLNPLTSVIEGFRWAILGTGTAPDLNLLIAFLITLPILVAGLFIFKRVERNIVDVA